MAAGSGIWVAARAFAAASHRGGTLTAAVESLPVPDPTQAYDFSTVSALETGYDGLVALRRSGGAPGLTLVPDLAVTLPRPTGGGTTYTFTLRPGIRYSNGTLVRASDFRLGFERQITVGLNPGYYDGILGAPACKRQPQRCDLSSGMVVDDAAGTITFHLAQADPDFLYNLAMLFAVPAAPGAPPHRVISGAPFLPGTGPYMISRYRPNASFTLVRNPYFRQWSYAAQPAGCPSVIRFERVISPAKQQAAVVAGRADLMQIGVDDQSLATRYPTRVHSALTMWTDYLFLNTRQPPFTNIKARQAVSYAIDRARMLQLFHFAPGQGAITCQILPADFPAHQSYCPYTTGTKDGSWHGPNMQKALQLAKDSGTKNMPVTVWTFEGPDRTVGIYLVRLLKDLGYRARLHMVPVVRFFDKVSDARSKIQIGLESWGADFPAASTFFLPVLTCRSFYRDPTNTQQPRWILRSVRRKAGQRGAGEATYGPRRRSEVVGTGGSHRHQQGTMGPGPQRSIDRIRLLPRRKLPRFRRIWTPARPNLAPIAVSGLVFLVFGRRSNGRSAVRGCRWACWGSDIPPQYGYWMALS